MSTGNIADDNSAARPAPARAGLTRTETDPDLVFDPETRWFSDVPLIRTLGDGRVEVIRGPLTDTEREFLAEHTRDAIPGATIGVFTNDLGRSSLHEPGATFSDDPRDTHFLAAHDLLDGDTVAEIAQRLRALADWLEECAAAGWVLWSLSADGLSITNAPERVPTETDILDR